jgi:flagellar P-ring protein precursor FlgI
MRTLTGLTLLILNFLPIPPMAANPVRVKELAALEGVRDNQLLGYGVVVGLNGTGDKRQPVFPAQTLVNLLERMGVQVPATAIQVRNVASVMVSANLPPFAQIGRAHV